MTTKTNYSSSNGGNPPRMFKNGTDPPKARKKTFLQLFPRAFFISYTLYPFHTKMSTLLG
jgi:hypothetical protein